MTAANRSQDFSDLLLIIKILTNAWTRTIKSSYGSLHCKDVLVNIVFCPIMSCLL